MHKQIGTQPKVQSIIMLISIVILFSTCRNEPNQKLLILHAGSLSLPFEQMAEVFMKEYPSVEVQTEAAGSRTCARKIIELGVPADIMASSDSAVIRNLLMPQFADFCIDFSSNEMVIMYRKESLYSNQISIDNWYEIIFRKAVEYGHSDPNSDPCGYRTLLCWQLAEKYYQVPGLYKKLRANMPVKNIRPKEVDLLALLETGELDYIFIYRSVAEQHGGLYLPLPDEINLKSTELEDFYKTAQVDITGKNPQETIKRKGAPMVYGITIPKTARNPDMAVKFLAFVLGPESQQIMQENGHPEFKPVLLDNLNSLPLKLRPFVQ